MAAKKGFTIAIDDKALSKQIKRALTLNPQETVKAVRECALDLSAASAKRAPIESGDLRSNCHADLNGVTIFENKQPTGAAPASATKATANVGYSLPYALRQHEELNYQHDRTDGHKVLETNKRTGQPNKTAGVTVNMVAGGEPKFLERPFEERKDRYIRRMEQIVERCLK